MKKALLIGLGILVIGVIVCFLVQDSQVSVSANDEDQTTLKTLFAEATNGKLQLVCDNNNNECSGTYKADNFIELVKYQNNLFKIADEYKLEFSSLGHGPIASWFD